MSDTPLMMPGFGNDFETEALPGALPTPLVARLQNALLLADVLA